MKKIIKLIIIVIFIWIAASTFIQAFKNPELTQMEVLKKIPQSFILDFNEKQPDTSYYWSVIWYDVTDSTGFTFISLKESIKPNPNCLKIDTIIILNDSIDYERYKFYRLKFCN